ncbi:MAG: sugar phosphate nucleotidyltransferase [Casimicrobiaceae bacterium]
MTRDVVVLAGGLGTRLAGVLGARPKALAEVAGRPFLDWLFEYLTREPVDRVIVSIGHLGDQLVARYGSRFEQLPIVYVREDRPLGTGGAILHAIRTVDCAAVFVLNGDTLLPVALGSLQGSQDDELVIAVREVGDASRYGTVRCHEGRVVSFHEKQAHGPGLVNAGSYWVRRSMLERIATPALPALALPEAFSFERDVLQAYGSHVAARAVVVNAPFIDIGTPEALAEAQLSIPALMRHLAATPSSS